MQHDMHGHVCPLASLHCIWSHQLCRSAYSTIVIMPTVAHQPGRTNLCSCACLGVQGWVRQGVVCGGLLWPLCGWQCDSVWSHVHSRVSRMYGCSAQTPGCALFGVPALIQGMLQSSQGCVRPTPALASC
jgi:hypothetical protein